MENGVRFFVNRYRLNAVAGLVLAFLVTACEPEAASDSYLGTWDPLFLTPQGEVIVLDNAGIKFTDEDVCFLGFDEQCFSSVFTQVGDVVSVNIGGEPDSYLLHMPFDGYLIVQQASDRPVFHIRREVE
ncbi:MAG: hypothetical protein GY788_29235 [bacterium]|nr:hypothetical protein [bacterium]